MVLDSQRQRQFVSISARKYIFISIAVVCFVVLFVCLFVCLLIGWLAGWLVLFVYGGILYGFFFLFFFCLIFFFFIDKSPIPVVEETKFLGVISFVQHLKYDKKKGLNTINILKVIDNTEW